MVPAKAVVATDKDEDVVMTDISSSLVSSSTLKVSGDQTNSPSFKKPPRQRLATFPQSDKETSSTGVKLEPMNTNPDPTAIQVNIFLFYLFMCVTFFCCCYCVLLSGCCLVVVLDT